MGPAEEGHSYGLRWKIERQSGLVTVRLQGELDLASGDALFGAVDGLAAEGALLVFDLAELEFMDSTGLRLLARVKQNSDESGHRFLLGRVSAPVLRVLHVSGLLAHFDYVEGQPPDEAL